MEQTQKVGSVGSVTESESLQGETLSGSVNLGPLKVTVSAEMDNAQALAYLASKLTGGMAHTAIVALQEALAAAEGAAAPAAAAPAAAAAPSA